ncbi:hypothetical protein BC826DRAFT_993576 [Russula brevipes]|nr:hypothetical protein BC826DRAFT_993576 [Russula brevipes]
MAQESQDHRRKETEREDQPFHATRPYYNPSGSSHWSTFMRDDPETGCGDYCGSRHFRPTFCKEETSHRPILISTFELTLDKLCLGDSRHSKLSCNTSFDSRTVTHVLFQAGWILRSPSARCHSSVLVRLVQKHSTARNTSAVAALAHGMTGPFARTLRTTEAAQERQAWVIWPFAVVCCFTPEWVSDVDMEGRTGTRVVIFRRPPVWLDSAAPL